MHGTTPCKTRRAGARLHFFQHRAPNLLILVPSLVAAATLHADKARAATPEDRKLVIMISAILDRADESEISEAVLFDRAFRDAGFALGITPVPKTEMRKDGLDDELRRCGSDVSCIRDRIERAGFDFGLLVSLNMSVAPGVLIVRLVESGRGSAHDSGLEEVEAKGAVLWAKLEKSIFSVLESAGHPIGGRLAVETAPQGAILAIDSEPKSGLDTRTFLLSPGEHQVTAKQSGYREAVARAVVARGGVASVSLHLEGEPSIFGSTWFWIAVGGAAAAAGVTAGVLYLRRDRDYPLCLHPRGVPCP